jgi:hypothetical protein
MSTSPTGPYCDMVMKGGITSGVVYPKAVTEIARTHTFKSIGGTSAGAIAAAAAAAAQLGKLRNAPDGGFALLEGLPGFLREENGSGHTNLFTFFQPQPATRGVFEVLTAALNCKGAWPVASRLARAAMEQYPGFALAGLMPGLALIILAITSDASALALVSVMLGVVLAILGTVGLSLWAVARDVGRVLPDNLFGLCTGMPGDPVPARAGASEGSGEALSDWLNGYLNRLSGLPSSGAPLTFGQLWDPNTPAGKQPKADAPEIVLEMLTTCLTWSRPFRLPFRDDEVVKENRFYFRKAEFERLFPASVVQWLCDHPRESLLPDQWKAEGYVPMPDPWNLPVVVATRMSLSFPVLLSAVPLYAYDMQIRGDDRKAQPPRRCWFSDGGICSNFPVHFFDSPLPRWPTFGINLVPKPADTQEDLSQPLMAKENKAQVQELWRDVGERRGFKGIFGFVSSIVNTMQNWSDEALGRLPGYRDRVAHVGLRPSEGGLNLDMPEELIKDLSTRGANAAKEFVKRFASDSMETMNWKNHRIIRLRSMLTALTEYVGSIDRACGEPHYGDVGYHELIAGIPTGRKKGSYAFATVDQRKRAARTIRVVRALHRMWSRPGKDGPISAAEQSPRPRAELRPRPRI